MPEPTPATKLRCQECGTPVAEIRDGHLLIRGKHHGQTHLTIIPVEELLLLLERARQQPHIAA